MKTQLLQKLCCPFDKSELHIEIIKEIDQEVLEGILTCTDCGRYYPIIYGIPIMTPDEYREKSLEQPMLQKWGLEIAEDQHSFVLSTSEGFTKIE